MKQKIIDVVIQTAEYEIDNEFDPEVGIFPTAEITNAQEVAEDVIKAYLTDAWKDFDPNNKKTWPLSGRYLTRINFEHANGETEKMIILQEFRKHNGKWWNYLAIQYLDLEAIRPECL